MPIQLDKILADIAQEKVLHPNFPQGSKKAVDDAWARVGKNNKLSVHEARSIFKVLQKKYEQEKTKRTPSWKLFELMEQIHQPMKEEDQKQDDDGMVSMEEDEEYEMLEVQEEEEPATGTGKLASSASDGESPSKSMKSGESTDTTPEKDEKPIVKAAHKSVSTAAATSSKSSPAAEEKKLLNSLAPSSRTSSSGANSTQTPNASTAATAAALHKKGITLKKAANNAAGGTPRPAQSTSSNAQQKNTLQMPESIKRKLVETQPGPQPSKKSNTAQSSASAVTSPAQSTATATATASAMRRTSTANNANTSTASQDSTLTLSNAHPINIKQEPIDTSGPTGGINLITITGNPRVELTNGVVGGGPSSSTAATVASTSTNGYSPRLEEIDFRNDIIFDAGNGPLNGTVAGGVNSTHPNAPGGIINLGNFDNSLPPTFFKNLCNSSRHEALGLYVANVMNRLRPRSAAKLELGILRAIIDVQSDELEQ